VGCAVAYPLDLVKTKMAGDLAHVSPRQGALIRCFSNILRQEGVRGLYKGIGATLTQVTPALAINFTAYELSKSYMSALIRRQPQSRQGQWAHWTSYLGVPHNGSHTEGMRSTGAGSPALILPAPTSGAETAAKCKGDTSNDAFQNTHCTTASTAHPDAPGSIAATHGKLASDDIAGQSAAEGSIDNSSDRGAAALPSKSQSQASAAGARDASQLSVYERALVSLVSGTASGVVSSTSTFPLDVVRRRLQVAPSSTSYMSVRSSSLPLNMDIAGTDVLPTTGHLLQTAVFLRSLKLVVLYRWCKACTRKVGWVHSTGACSQNI
jgi:hypothetical protein